MVEGSERGYPEPFCSIANQDELMREFFFVLFHRKWIGMGKVKGAIALLAMRRYGDEWAVARARRRNPSIFL